LHMKASDLSASGGFIRPPEAGKPLEDSCKIQVFSAA